LIHFFIPTDFFNFLVINRGSFGRHRCVTHFSGKSFGNVLNQRRCLNLIFNLDQQPEDPFCATDEWIATLRNTARAQRNPETSGML
jgi:hypothetical protein